MGAGSVYTETRQPHGLQEGPGRAKTHQLKGGAVANTIKPEYWVTGGETRVARAQETGLPFFALATTFYLGQVFGYSEYDRVFGQTKYPSHSFTHADSWF